MKTVYSIWKSEDYYDSLVGLYSSMKKAQIALESLISEDKRLTVKRCLKFDARFKGVSFEDGLKMIDKYYTFNDFEIQKLDVE